jgi:hypothetical protein
MSGRALRVQVRVDGAGEAETQKVGTKVAALLTELRRDYAGAQSVVLIDALPAEAKLVPRLLHPLFGKMPRSG